MHDHARCCGNWPCRPFVTVAKRTMSRLTPFKLLISHILVVDTPACVTTSLYNRDSPGHRDSRGDGAPVVSLALSSLHSCALIWFPAKLADLTCALTQLCGRRLIKMASGDGLCSLSCTSIDSVTVTPTAEQLSVEDPTRCPVPGCDREFLNSSRLLMHTLRRHEGRLLSSVAHGNKNKGFFCPVEMCSRSKGGKPFTRLGKLKQVKHNVGCY